jgi:AraC-like DNA-binding protein
MRAQLGNVGTNAVDDARWRIMIPTSAFDGCRIDRVPDVGVEIVEADPANRAFPDRVNESLGICLKLGPEHDLWAEGRALRYPRDAVCVRTPGSVWSVRATGPVGFISVDIDREHLPPGGVRGGIRFAEARALPDVRRAVTLLRSSASLIRRQTVVTGLVNALLQAGLVSTPDLGPGLERRAVDRARELLSARMAAPPSLQELADAVGANRFVLLRQFRRRVGLPPHAYVLRLRVERARSLLARGADIADVAFLLGFSDQSHFSRLFKRVVGIPPGDYRRRVLPLG